MAALLRDRFVPMAIDNVDFPNQTAAERDFLIDNGWTASTNGQSAFTADGRLRLPDAGGPIWFWPAALIGMVDLLVAGAAVAAISSRSRDLGRILAGGPTRG